VALSVTASGLIGHGVRIAIEIGLRPQPRINSDEGVVSAPVIIGQGVGIAVEFGVRRVSELMVVRMLFDLRDTAMTSRVELWPLFSQ
jgi:hypothetical protein